MFKEYYKALYKCFFSSDLYVNVVYKWRNHTGIGFVTLLVTILAILNTGAFSINIEPVVEKFVDHASITAPEHYSIKDGILTIDKQLPYIMTVADVIPDDVFDEDDEDETSLNTPMIIFQESVSVEDTNQYKNGIILVGKTQFISRDEKGKVEIHKFDGIDDFDFNLSENIPFELSKFLGLFKYLAIFILLVFFIISMWISYLVMSFITAIISFLVTIAVPIKDITFNDRFRIAIFAYAPIYIIKVILGLTEIGHIGVFTSIVASALVFCAIIFVAKKTFKKSDTERVK